MKQKVDFGNKLDDVRFDFKGIEVIVFPHIKTDDKIILAEVYADALLISPDTVRGYFVAENSLILGILDMYTNIEIYADEVSEDGIRSLGIDMDDVVRSGLWNEIKGRLTNYDELRRDITKIVQIKREDLTTAMSVGKVLDSFADKIIEFLDRMNEWDMEEFKTVIENASPAIDRVGNILETVSGEPKVEKKRRHRKPKAEQEAKESEDVKE